MSSDNGIYILHTKDRYKQIFPGFYENVGNNGIDAYRVAHAQAIDNFDWYKENEPYNLGAYMVDVWGNGDVYYSLDEARGKAKEIKDSIGRTEYGISTIDATDMSFYGI